MKRFKVTCLNCKQFDIVSILEEDHQIMNFEKGASSNLLAGRWRQSGDWGWECKCGNDNRISKSEESFFDILVNGTPQQLDTIKATLKLDDKRQFSMGGV